MNWEGQVAIAIHPTSLHGSLLQLVKVMCPLVSKLVRVETVALRLDTQLQVNDGRSEIIVHQHAR